MMPVSLKTFRSGTERRFDVAEDRLLQLGKGFDGVIHGIRALGKAYIDDLGANFVCDTLGYLSRYVAERPAVARIWRRLTG